MNIKLVLEIKLSLCFEVEFLYWTSVFCSWIELGKAASYIFHTNTWRSISVLYLKMHLHLSCTLTMFVASTKAPAVTSTSGAWDTLMLSQNSKVHGKRNLCSQREVGNSNIQMTAELNATDISALQYFIPVNYFYQHL